MKLCRYWAFAEAPATDAKGTKLRVKKWGGSNASREDAQKLAESALQELVRRISTLELRHFSRAADYTYSMREVPEELVKELTPKSGITRNGKGCLVLNTQELLFADVDVKRPGFFAKLFGATYEQAEQACIDALKKWLEQHGEAGVRIYRTRAGLRYLFTHAPLAVNDDTIRWLTELGSDKLYVRLCKNQNCFRARLTPKPYRIGCSRINGHYPFDAPEMKKGFDDWLRAYERNSEPFAVCKLVETAGSGGTHRDLDALIKEHDRATRCDRDLPLA